MLKSLLYSGLLTCLSLFAFAQDQTYPVYQGGVLEGLQSEDGQLFYSIVRGNPVEDTTYSFVVQTFDADLNRLEHHRIPSCWGCSFEDVAEHQGGIMAYFKDDEIGELFIYDKNGKLVNTHRWEREEDEYNDVKLASNGTQGIIIARPHEEDEEGFMLTAYDANFAELWSASDFPERGDIVPQQLFVKGEYVALVTHYSRGTFSNTYEDKVYVYNRKTGTLEYVALAANNEDNGVPSNYLLNSDGSLFVAGPVYNGNDLEGYFFKGFAADGTSSFNTVKTVEEGFSDELWSEHSQKAFPNDYMPPKLFIHDVQKTTSGYRIIGETFALFTGPRKQGTTALDGYYRVLDFVVFNIGMDGSVSPLHLISKPYKVITLSVSSLMSDRSNADFLEANKHFSYRFMDGEDIISNEWNQGTVYIGRTNISATEDNVLERIFMQQTVPNSRSDNFSTYAPQRTAGSMNSPAPLPYDIVRTVGESRAIFYSISSGKMTLKKVDGTGGTVSGNEVVDGRLDIPGIPSSRFMGVHALENGDFYTFYLSEKISGDRNRYVFHQLDASLQTVGRSSLEVPEDAVYVGICHRGGDNIMVFQRYSTVELLFYVLNNQGELTSSFTHSFGLPGEMSFYAPPVLKGGVSEIYVIQSVQKASGDQQLRGYQLVKIDNSNQIMWEQENTAETLQFIQIGNIAANDDVLAVLHRLLHHRNQRDPETHLRLYNARTGALIADKLLEERGHGVFTEYMDIDASSRVVLGGQYFETLDVDKTPFGIFFMALNSDGTEAFAHFDSWEGVENELQKWGVSDFIDHGSTKILGEDLIQMPNGEFMVINELYRGDYGFGDLFGADDGMVVFTTYEFVTYHFSNSGELLEINIIHKQEQGIEIPESLLWGGAFTLPTAMKQLEAFSFLKTEWVDGTPYIVYQNSPDTLKVFRQELISMNSEPQFAIAKFEFPRDPDAEESTLDRWSGRLERLESQTLSEVEGIDYTYSDLYDRLTGYAMGIDGEVVLYKYDSAAQTLHLHAVKMR